MLKNYIKIALRNLSRHKIFSFINLGGLAVGMAVAMLIGLWIWDELSFNKNFKNHDKIAAVWQNQTFNGFKGTQRSVPYVLGDEIKAKYGSDFKYVVMCSWEGEHALSYGDKKLLPSGNFFEPEITEVVSR
ncbi:ABC transporter permease [Solitalea sp. MAHUQ-68]|uniref:ABC transporter permease n=1 Tax=Solitalea agri TaxID=2953739 RepID=A0A9X2JBA8_9SPHI|nr:ABC transporter permease [Solitalea agri]MCO4291833.1 ABC transporter permease [Solitalea agri]